MARTHHLWMTGALIVCFASTQLNGTLLASEELSPTEASAPQSLVGSTSETHAPSTYTERSPFTFNDGGLLANRPLELVAPGSRGAFNGEALQPRAFAGQVYRGRPIRSNRDGSVAAIMIGAVASITGAALLVYANRPDCNVNPFAGGCGYGTKVVGGAVLTGGIVGLTVGALTWR